jgi:hypothetical protein
VATDGDAGGVTDGVAMKGLDRSRVLVRFALFVYRGEGIRICIGDRVYEREWWWVELLGKKFKEERAAVV